MFTSAILLAAFALTGVSLLFLVHAATKERIENNERALLLTQLNEIVPSGTYDNDPVTDIRTIAAPEALGSDEPLTVYRARRGDKTVAAILTTVAPDGYNGAIRLLVGIRANGELAGVRAIHHRETPGLGDRIDAARSDWILDFNGKSLNQSQPGQWRVKPDGGSFDSFTGATITPRAVVKAVHKALVYFDENQDFLFDAHIEKSK
ncbi:MAG: electron transport complex subunit RsxG [Gammaproteobacteria bacterium]|nr:electron transport complex subunit RsxG [Gammaproteobacteria bacterium]